MSYQNRKATIKEEIINNEYSVIDTYMNDHKTNENNANDYTPINEAYFAFIDVLGFKKTFEDVKVILSNDNSGFNHDKIIKKYKDVFNYFFKLMNNSKIYKKPNCYFGQTSDSLYFYCDNIEYLFVFLSIFTHFNEYAMQNDVFFRGGIAKGNLYKKEEYQFYGDSVIHSFLLESNIAKNPIINISIDVYENIKDHNLFKTLFNHEKSTDRCFLKLFYDRENFNLSTYFNGEIELEEINYSKICENIVKNKKFFEFDAKNYGKYEFLFNEYNNFMKKKVGECSEK